MICDLIFYPGMFLTQFIWIYLVILITKLLFNKKFYTDFAACLCFLFYIISIIPLLIMITLDGSRNNTCDSLGVLLGMSFFAIVPIPLAIIVTIRIWQMLTKYISNFIKKRINKN